MSDELQKVSLEAAELVRAVNKLARSSSFEQVRLLPDVLRALVNWVVSIDGRVNHGK